MMKHYSVLLQESIDSLVIKPNGIYVDGTLGRAGHSSEILKMIPLGHLYCFDKDAQAISESSVKLSKISSNFTCIHSGFKNLQNELSKFDVQEIDGMILDLGVSSPQSDEAARGFSYRFDAPLDMRMDQSQDLNAAIVVNTYEFNDLVKIFYRYGEDQLAKQVARKIERAREIKPIETTFELVNIIKSAYPAKILNSKGHPAKKIFQAIRIEVNDELNELEIVLEQAIQMLKIGGRLSVISFQSLEDRIVKDTFNRYGTMPKIDKRIPLMPGQIETAPFKVITKKPILANEEELKENNRSHSAKLRVIERVK